MNDSSLLLLLGPELGEKEDFLHALRRRIDKAAGGALEVGKYFAFETPLEQVIGSLQNGKLFASHSLAIVRNAESIKGKDSVAALKAFAAKPPDGATLVLVSDAYKVDRGVAGVVPKAATRVFWELFEDKKRSWVAGYFQKAGVTVGEEGIDLILEMVPNDTLSLRTECANLCFHYEGKAELTVDDLDAFLVHDRGETVYTLFDALVTRDLNLGLEVLQKILLSGDANASQVVGGLYRQFSALRTLSAARSQGLPAEQMFRDLRILGKKRQAAYQKALRAYSEQEVNGVILLLADLDRRLRDGRGDIHALMLEHAVYRIVEHSGAVPEVWPAPRW
jgi:DNA polymerase-3 subunit delta